MKVFISHTFKEDDRKLAAKLQACLKLKSIDGYLAERKQEYELLIRDKIKNEIELSDYLVAIITQYGLKSASVHEEIGYAIGSGIPVLLMVDESLEEQGVLIHGKEPEYFSEKIFEQHADKIVNFIMEKNKQQAQFSEESPSKDFLDSRHIISIDDTSFCQNSNFDSMLLDTNADLIPHGKPVVLFSACPKSIKKLFTVNSNDFYEWIKQHSFLEIEGHKIAFFSGNKEIDIGLVNFLFSPRGDGENSHYFEIHDTGFLEQGITRPLVFSDVGYDKQHYAFLHLCWLTGSFWAFLKFCRLFYDWIEFKEKFDVFLSIKNTQDLMLMGFGGKMDDTHTWAEPYSIHYMSKKPKTKRPNISLKIDSLTSEQLTDEYIQKKVREFSDLVSNAYGLEKSRCYNHDGSFNFELMFYYL